MPPARSRRGGAGRPATGGRGRWGGGAAAAPDDPDDYEACREAALRLLDAAPRSSGALRERLVAKGYTEATAAAVVDRLAEVSLLDDRAYAESVVRQCAARMLGRRATMVELTRKGVARTLAEEVAEEAAQAGVFEDAAWELGRKVAARTRGLDSAVRKRRLWSAGARKGHGPDVLREVAQVLIDGDGTFDD
ncbi:regulatory protein RecX [Bifidobacterium pullorum subsp. saeculare]|uniref:Regulatory protein RecX n=1 Tax=Bifidobacterium pullorum subsp. saeculare TaxID=78257 RepID=A0A938WZI1_9BIFI|nr:regulatory protein RecX [Bifidobacterium pullorum subsp. saeculare]